MKEVFFNSLTRNVFVDENEVMRVVDCYVAVVKRAVQLGYNKVCYEDSIGDINLTSTDSLKSYCSKHTHDIGCMLLLTTQSRPYIKDDEEEKITQYVDGRFCLWVNSQKYDDLCFAAAYLSNSFLVGFNVSDEWLHLKYSFEGSVNGKDFKEDIYCVVSDDQYDNNDFCQWRDEHDYIDEASIKKSDKSPDEKSIQLRDDHGKNKLSEHAKKLLMSPYVEHIINSTQFKPCAKNYIDKVTDDGKIEVVLTKTDCGYGMVVQTTGRNRKETLWIAERLKDKYADRQ